MKTKIFISMITCLFSYIISQAQVFVIERGSNTLTFTNIKEAVDALQDDDKFFIPPGVHSLRGYTWTGYDKDVNYSDILVVRKKVSIYGAGYGDVANLTVIEDGTFVIGKGADGSSISGIRFREYGVLRLDNVSDCVVSRCRMDDQFYLTGTGENISVSECDMRSYVNTSASSDYTPEEPGTGLITIFGKCIFRNYFMGSVFKSTVYNSILLFHWYWYPIVGTYSHYYNNIICVDNTEITGRKIENLGQYNTFANNLWIGGYLAPNADDFNTFTDEIESQAYADVFVDPDNDDFHLKATCKGKNAGIDGTDVGIYGTAVPFKENKLPAIPLFKVKVISPETDTEGKLPVNIQVEAQDY